MWWDGRVVDCGGLENRCGESHRGFKSYSHRHLWRGAGAGRSGLPAKQLWRKPSWVRIPSSPPFFYNAPVAQRIEHLTTDQNVGGSSPLGRVSDLLYQVLEICLTGLDGKNSALKRLDGIFSAYYKLGGRRAIPSNDDIMTITNSQAGTIMQAYRTHLVIENPQQVTFSNLPFQPGQYVEVLFLAYDESRAAAVQELKALLKETQSLSQIQALSEDDIVAEIAAYRSRQ